MIHLPKNPRISLVAAGCVAALLGACGGHQTAAKGQANASASLNASANVSNGRTVAPRDDSATTMALSPELRHACQMPAAADETPQFDYDDAKLKPRGENILNDVATCLTDGPLRGRNITIVGRADPRGSQEHNEELGVSRASATRAYLMDRGVTVDRIQMVSRGEKDARGDDESTWALDRRVDINLGSTETERASAVEGTAASASSGVLVQATKKAVKREPDPKRAKGATYSDAVETGDEGPPQSKAVPPRP